MPRWVKRCQSPDPDFFSPRCPRALPRALKTLPERLLMVAAMLGVCRATIYKLCDRGDLAHVRVSNAIRFERHHLGGVPGAAALGIALNPQGGRSSAPGSASPSRPSPWKAEAWRR